jgi:hypothetical protein
MTIAVSAPGQHIAKRIVSPFDQTSFSLYGSAFA